MAEFVESSNIKENTYNSRLQKIHLGQNNFVPITKSSILGKAFTDLTKIL